MDAEDQDKRGIGPYRKLLPRYGKFGSLQKRQRIGKRGETLYTKNNKMEIKKKPGHFSRN